VCTASFENETRIDKMTIKYTEEHEWLTIDGDIATVGVTDYAQHQLGDVVFVELPEVGSAFSAGDNASVVESVKAASDVMAPITGEITQINPDLGEAPGTVNSDPTGHGWFFKMTIADRNELDIMMDAATYKTFITELD